MRIGMGYDVHRLTANRDLILGGVKIPWELGLLGHSDADVLLHAIMDALLGAAALGDMKKLIDSSGYEVGNIDATIIAQKPKMAPHIPEMIRNVAETLEIPVSCVNIKATTEEGLGFTGRGEGIAAQAVCLLNNKMEERES